MRVVIVGGGLGGCAAAIALRKVGCEVKVFEGAAQPRREGQSVSLLMSGTAAYAALDVGPQPGHRITKVTFLRRRSGRPMMNIDAASLESRFGHPYVVVPRRELLEPLLKALGDSVAFSKTATGVHDSDSSASVLFSDGSCEEADLVVVADGARSALRSALWPDDTGRFFSFAFQGTVPVPGDYGEPDRVVMCLGPGTLTGTFPTTGDQLGWVIDRRAPSPDGRPESVKDYLLSEFEDWPGGIADLIESTPDQEVEREIYPIYVRRPRWGQGRVVLVGDAAHSFNPAIGQGTNQAFTDAVVLADVVSRTDRAGDVLGDYAGRRDRRVTMLWRMSQMSLNPAFARFSDIARWNSDRMATRSWTVLVRPDRVVRRVVARS